MLQFVLSRGRREQSERNARGQQRMDKRRILLHVSTPPEGCPSVSARLEPPTLVTHDAVLAQDPDNLILLVREKIRVPECSSAAFHPVLELVPLPRLSCEGIDVKDVVFPFRLVWTVQEEVMGVRKGDIWDWREQRLEDHAHGGW